MAQVVLTTVCVFVGLLLAARTHGSLVSLQHGNEDALELRPSDPD